MICIFVVRHVFFYLIFDMYHAILGSFAYIQPTRMFMFLRVSKFEDDWRRALRSSRRFQFTSRRAEHVREWNETSTGKLDPSAFGYPQDAHTDDLQQQNCADEASFEV